MMTPEREILFERCWHQDMPRVMRYAQRHVGLNEAHDVVSETFAVAWRRWDEVPDPPLPWLIGVARHNIGNSLRARTRRRRLRTRLQTLEEVVDHSATFIDPTQRLDALLRLASLKFGEREALLLVAWDGLSVIEAASALGVSPDALRQRIARARRALDGADLAESTETLRPSVRNHDEH